MFVDNFTAGMAQDEEGVYEMTLALWDWGFDIQDGNDISMSLR